MAITVRQEEAVPDSLPAVPAGLSEAAAALDSAAVWARIEAYVAHRWSPREVVWVVEGAGEWIPPLTPATVSKTEVWGQIGFSEASLAPSPLGGLDLPGGTHRITATVGGGEVPAEVQEAFRRLAEYMAETSERPGASSYSVNIGGAIIEEVTRAPAWMARAMQNSGAADLLRKYRRA